MLRLVGEHGAVETLGDVETIELRFPRFGELEHLLAFLLAGLSERARFQDLERAALAPTPQRCRERLAGSAWPGSSASTVCSTPRAGGVAEAGREHAGRFGAEVSSGRGAAMSALEPAPGRARSTARR